MISIFVISLAEATERRKRISKILTDYNVPFEFYDAIDGRQFNIHEQSIYDAKKRLRYFGKRSATSTQSVSGLLLKTLI